MAKRGKTKQARSRRVSAITGLVASFILLLLSTLGNWYVHHPRDWRKDAEKNLPKSAVEFLYWIGNPSADFTDALGWTGTDAVYEFDEEAPSGSVTFAGLPVRTKAPAPADIRVINRGNFIIGWSDSLRHPAWCAYHVTKEKKFNDGQRPSFAHDKAVPLSPKPDDYTKSGFDRGHMAPNHAIVSRYGDADRKLTFLMSNIAPQRPALNRGVWRDVEHRIADLWTAKYGEIWVIVGSIPSASGQRFAGGIDIPESYFQLIVAQEGMDVRALAVVIPQEVGWKAWAARYIVTIDELEELTGFDFLSTLPSFIQDPLEAELPTRLWPIRIQDIIKLIVPKA